MCGWSSALNFPSSFASTTCALTASGSHVGSAVATYFLPSSHDEFVSSSPTRSVAGVASRRSNPSFRLSRRVPSYVSTVRVGSL